MSVSEKVVVVLINGLYELDSPGPHGEAQGRGV
jgi:hypothetical protein